MPMKPNTSLKVDARNDRIATRLELQFRALPPGALAHILLRVEPGLSFLLPDTFSPVWSYSGWDARFRSEPDPRLLGAEGTVCLNSRRRGIATDTAVGNVWPRRVRID